MYVQYNDDRNIRIYLGRKSDGCNVLQRLSVCVRDNFKTYKETFVDKFFWWLDIAIRTFCGFWIVRNRAQTDTLQCILAWCRPWKGFDAILRRGGIRIRRSGPKCKRGRHTLYHTLHHTHIVVHNSSCFSRSHFVIIYNKGQLLLIALKNSYRKRTKRLCFYC